MTTVPATTTGWSVGALPAVQSCLSEAGTWWASLGLGAGPAAGRLMVARASLVHQINAAAVATTVAIAAAASRSALVRRSGLTIERGDAGSVGGGYGSFSARAGAAAATPCTGAVAGRGLGITCGR